MMEGTVVESGENLPGTRHRNSTPSARFIHDGKPSRTPRRRGTTSTITPSPIRAEANSAKGKTVSVGKLRSIASKLSVIILGICTGFAFIVLGALSLHHPHHGAYAKKNLPKKGSIQPNATSQETTFEQTDRALREFPKLERIAEQPPGLIRKGGHAWGSNERVPDNLSGGLKVAVLVRTRHENRHKSLAYNILQPGLKKVFSCDLKSLKIVILCSYDEFEDDEEYRERINAIFEKERLSHSFDHKIELKFVSTSGNPCRVWNELGRVAFKEEKADYFLQLNDDSKLLTPCALSILVGDLQANRQAKNLGVVAPYDVQNPQYVTKAFVHRNHFLIFDQLLPSPPKRHEEWCIDQEYWLSHVYGTKSTKIDHRVKVRNVGKLPFEMKPPHLLDSRQYHWLVEEIHLGKQMITDFLALQVITMNAELGGNTRGKRGRRRHRRTDRSFSHDSGESAVARQMVHRRKARRDNKRRHRLFKRWARQDHGQD